MNKATKAPTSPSIVKYLISRFKRSDIEIDNDTAKYLLQAAGNIPYYIQYIAFEISQNIILSDKNSITTKYIDEAVKRILELKSDYYWELTNKHTSYRKKVLCALSQSASELFSKKTAKDFDLGAVSSTQKAIDVFINDGIIERNQSKYDFSDPIYKKFINRYL